MSSALPPSPPSRDLRITGWPGYALLLVLAIVVTVVSLVVADRWAAQRALLDTAAQARNTAQLNAALLRNDLDRFRALPLVLARDAEIRAVLAAPGAVFQGAQPGQSPGGLSLIVPDLTEGPPAPKVVGALALNRKLEALSDSVGASAIYLLDDTGLTVAASNWRDPVSFLGINYQFRPYFRDAVQDGVGEHFALGTASNEPGLYLSRRVDGAGGTPLGVVVVKVNFAALESNWRQLDAPVFVTDAQGVVLLGSEPGWRFATTQPLSASAAESLRRSLQYGDRPLAPLPLLGAGASAGKGLETVQVQLPGEARSRRYLHTVLAVEPMPGWMLHQLMPTGMALAQARASARANTLLGLVLVLTGVGLALYRRVLALRRVQAQRVIRQELEARVDVATHQLRDANARLLAEMEERQRTESQLHQMRDDLMQANRLVLLGQVAAGIAHEINQPVAAIRAYADNSNEFLARGNTDAAQRNLGRIADLTERIGRITGELRTFSRKSSVGIGPVDLNQSLNGALLILGPRLRRQGAVLQVSAFAKPLMVMAERMRLEQVLVNLLQNALEALEQTPAPRIALSVVVEGSHVCIQIHDNGPGLSPQALAGLFTPFSTTKPQGLGLGLVISRDIVSEFGGELTALNHADGGALFIVRLQASA